MWREDHFSFEGEPYKVEDALMHPKPATKPRPMIYAGGESEAAKQLIASQCDAYVMHGDEPARVRQKIADMTTRREKLDLPPMNLGVSGYTIIRATASEPRKERKRATNVNDSAAGCE